jgi:hypothetical protein
MNFGIMVLVACIITVAMYLFVKSVSASSFIVNENKMSSPDIPATWNLDWQGGPGFDRFKILHEKGPYNPHGFTESE